MHGRRQVRSWSAIAGVGANVVVVAAMMSMWLVVWRAPRDLPIGATQFWIDYVAPRALVAFGVLMPMLALLGAVVSIALSRRSIGGRSR